MIEYRVQRKSKGEWYFLTDRHGKYYTYSSLATAQKYGLRHSWQIWDAERGEYVVDPESFRIVMADIEWVPID